MPDKKTGSDSWTFPPLPCQYLQTQIDDETNCFRKLWFAVMIEAIDCTRGKITINGSNGHTNKAWKRNIANEAWRWFRSEATKQGSFLWVCLMLGLDSDRIRKYVYACEQGIDGHRHRICGGQGWRRNRKTNHLHLVPGPDRSEHKKSVQRDAGVSAIF